MDLRGGAVLGGGQDLQPAAAVARRHRTDTHGALLVKDRNVSDPEAEKPPRYRLRVSNVLLPFKLRMTFDPYSPFVPAS